MWDLYFSFHFRLRKNYPQYQTYSPDVQVVKVHGLLGHDEPYGAKYEHSDDGHQLDGHSERAVALLGRNDVSDNRITPVDCYVDIHVLLYYRQQHLFLDTTPAAYRLSMCLSTSLLVSDFMASHPAISLMIRVTILTASLFF